MDIKFYNTLTNTTETYNPANGAFASGPTMSTTRTGHTATALVNGDVVLAGGNTDWPSNLVATSSIETFSANNLSITLPDGRTMPLPARGPTSQTKAA